MLRRTRYFLVGTTFGALIATVAIPTVALGFAMVITDEEYDAITDAVRKIRATLES